MATNKAVEKLAFTYGETADAAGISVGLVRQLVANGKLEMVKINRCARIPRHALLALCGASKEGGD
jgi:excisionase family DNA binding protein